jgi:hypothetical protein
VHAEAEGRAGNVVVLDAVVLQAALLGLSVVAVAIDPIDPGSHGPGEGTFAQVATGVVFFALYTLPTFALWLAVLFGVRRLWARPLVRVVAVLLSPLIVAVLLALLVSSEGAGSPWTVATAVGAVLYALVARLPGDRVSGAAALGSAAMLGAAYLVLAVGWALESG